MLDRQVSKIYKVVYESNNGGCVLYDRMKAVFPNRSVSKHIRCGVALVDQRSYEDKGNYCFARMENVVTVEPSKYRDIQHYVGVGVPERIYRGSYYDCIFFKEVYGKTTYIKAYDINGNVLISEQKNNNELDSSELNSIFYRELAEVIVGWEDITNEVYTGIEKSILGKNSAIDLEDIRVLSLLKSIPDNGNIVRTHNNVIVAEGVYNNLVIYQESGIVFSCWTDKQISLEGSDVKEDIRNIRKNKYLINNPKGTSRVNIGKLQVEEDYLLKAINDNVLRCYRVVNDKDGILLFISLANINNLSQGEVKSLIDYVTQHNKSVLDKLSEMTIANAKESMNRGYRGDWLSKFY